MQDITGYQLSLQQERLYRLMQQETLAYAAQCVARLEGKLEEGRLQKALQTVVSRHEILRTRFCRAAEIDLPFQVVSEEVSLVWRNAELIEVTGHQREGDLEKSLEAQRQQVCDLVQETLLHSALLKLSAEEHLLILTLPAICADHSTIKNLFDELVGNYAVGELEDAASAVPIQYADYSAWQHNALESSDESIGRGYVERQEAPARVSPKLPFECRVEQAAVPQPSCLVRPFSSDESAQVEKIAREYKTSVETFLLSCWCALLWRLTGEEDINVYNLISGRSYEELWRAMGPFAWYLPLQSSFNESLRFDEHLRRTDQTTRQADERPDQFAWGKNRYANLKATDPASLPIGFSFAERPARRLAAGVYFSLWRQNVRADCLKLELSCCRLDSNLTAEFRYDQRLYREDDIGRLSEGFHTLVKSAISDPGAPIICYEILSQSERHQLLVEFNQTRVDYLTGHCLPELFAQQVERAPDSLALIFEERQLTYAELDARTNQFARYLQEREVGPDVAVAILLESSIEMVVAMLAILKAGGAYVPIDTAQPTQRLQLILDDVSPAVIITSQHLKGALQGQLAHTVCMDADPSDFSNNSQESLPRKAGLESLAYIIYTSGSTGMPKGVAVEHRQILNYLHGIWQRLGLETGAGYALVSTFAADLGNTVIFPSLATGGGLHIISRERICNSESLAAYFQCNFIDCLKIVPSHLEALMSCLHPHHVLPRQRLVLGGEASRSAFLTKLQSLDPRCAIMNHYGPTETTVGVLTYEFGSGSEPPSKDYLWSGRTLPLGRPLPNTRLYSMDADLRPVPIWAPGEIFVGGDNVTRGYFNRPDLTAEKFVPDPYSQQPGERLFKTGDLARYLPDGIIEFFGRKDHQVKIRGFRVEPGEIEFALGSHPNVDKTIVTVREDTPGKETLVAYIVARQQPAPTAEELRYFLKEKLPDHLIPSAFVTLEGIPLTTNGKIDRKALPPPDKTNHRNFVPPRNPIEHALARLWSEVLGVEQIGVHDNFFELGGHSLLGIQLLSRVQDSFQIELPLVLMFEAPTVANLAEELAKHEEIPGQVERVAAILQEVEGMDATVMEEIL